MKVKHMIELLSKQDPEMDVFMYLNEEEGYGEPTRVDLIPTVEKSRYSKADGLDEKCFPCIVINCEYAG